MRNFEVSQSKILSGSKGKLSIEISLYSLSRSIKEEPKTLNNMKKVLKNSKVLRNFRLDGSKNPNQAPENSTQFVASAIVRLVESLKNHLALVKADFFFGGE